MNTLELTAVISAVAAGAGFLGALTGLGGGVVLVPVLTLLFRIDIHYAMGASLVSVIATSSGAASAYVREGFSNIRIAMFLEMATSVGAIVGASLVSFLPVSAISVLFGVVLVYSAYESARNKHQEVPLAESDEAAESLRLADVYPGPDGDIAYGVQKPYAGFGVMGLAGLLSGLLGIGSGAVKVIAMDRIMGLPFKVSTTTSNFMIGVTAAASAGIYLNRGYIDPRLAMPVMLGVLVGSFFGSRMLVAANVKELRILFAVAIGALGLEMLFEGVRRFL
jgi:uncharacterized membrane protein YfcA